MELTIKNDDLGKVIGRVLTEGEGEPVFAGKTPQQQAEDLVATYALDILRNGMAQGKDIGFAYEDLPGLPAAAAACYRTYRKTETAAISAEGTAKSLAAYFMVLAWNEHDAAWDVRQRPVLMDPSTPENPNLWGMYSVTVNGADFLRAVNDGRRMLNEGGKRLLAFDLNPLMDAYRKATGGDLAKKGLVNIVFDR